ncbi:uncharacterized protein PGTG_19636 [Puccinia graminis f. sp. tritici CRL 75-36-700-3]|uniref:Chitin-binding type-2 domain-containing protein n=1 Tax=Puccinia graminis f. sp. tritici (strain CRL 75-36-700-3 / race SCCL) TaxID=418459 RepID=E3LAK8_PUCGT|nr:uncharacterized protein PGTG_19636 [Puccinia graminis f. sp. tritici CRL 75-36-700-3]EFP93583.2 hypothetical protein PGTG_19636 [Puccinia graminis f. sp. tritici CRL 75-36-700-3]
MPTIKSIFLLTVACLLSAPMAKGSPRMDPASSGCAHSIRSIASKDFTCQATYICYAGYSHPCGYGLTGEVEQCESCNDYSILSISACPYGNHPSRSCGRHAVVNPRAGERRKYTDMS